MTVMTSQISKFVNVTKTQKSRYLKSETFFLQIKKLFNYTSRATIWQKCFCSGGNLKVGFSYFTIVLELVSKIPSLASDIKDDPSTLLPLIGVTLHQVFVETLPSFLHPQSSYNQNIHTGGWHSRIACQLQMERLPPRIPLESLVRFLDPTSLTAVHHRSLRDSIFIVLKSNMEKVRHKHFEVLQNGMNKVRTKLLSETAIRGVL